MVFGEVASGSSDGGIIDAVGFGASSQGKCRDMENVLGVAQDYPDSTRGRLMADVQPDADLTRIVVGRRMLYAKTHNT